MLTVDKDPDVLIGVLFVKSGDWEKEDIAY